MLMAKKRPKMPVPPGELSPQQLADRIRDWAASQGYRYSLGPHASEFGTVRVSDPAGGHTTAVIPNAHHGRRLRKDQVRYTVRDLNSHWED
jgi:hypothetical protein